MAADSNSLLQTYYPSCIVDLRIRFDETMTATSDTFPRLSKDELVNTSQVGPPYIGAPRLVEYKSQTDATQLSARIPKTARIDLPAYRTAGKWSLTFDYNDLPIDPRTVRSLGVSIYLDSVRAEDFANNIGGTVSLPAGQQGAIMRRSSKLSMLNPSFENCAMQGVADNWSVSHTSSGSTVTIEGRDLRGCLLDSPITTLLLAALPVQETIVDVVKWLVQKHEYGGMMKVNAPDPAEWPKSVIPSPYTADGITRVNKGADGKKTTGVMIDSKPEVLNYWDVIVKYCQLVGAVPYFQGPVLWIKPARNLYDQQSAGTSKGRYPTPFKGGQPRQIDSQPVSVRRLMFGRNVDEYNVERKMGGRTPGQIEVTSLDTSSKERGQQKLLIARWPVDEAAQPQPRAALTPNQKRNQTLKTQALAKDLPASLVSGISPTDSAGKKDVVRISVPGISNLDRLRQIAQDLYEEIGRGELGGSIRTRSLASFGGDNEDPDLLRLRPGDAIQIQVDARNLRFSAGKVAGAPLSDFAGMTDAALVNYLTAKMGDANLARVIVAAGRNAIADMQNTYRVSNVTFDWSADRGVEIGFDFHNFVILRDAVTETPVVQNPTTAVSATAGVPRQRGR